MPHDAVRIPGSAAKRAAAPPAGLRAQPRLVPPSQQAAMQQMLQLGAAEGRPLIPSEQAAIHHVLQLRADSRTRPLRPSEEAAIWDALQRRSAEPEALSPETPRSDGLPGRLKAGIEALSGLAMDDVRVHRNSPEPANLGALAFTKGSDIHLGPGQDEHLPHEAWHVVQQKRGRVRATAQLKGIALNDDAGLEAEADRIGSRLEERASPPVIDLVYQAAPIRPVIQGKLVHQGGPLKKKKPPAPPSALIDELERSPQRLFLRDDWDPAKPESNIHLLDGTKKYLLGEDHDKSTWNTDVAQWSHIAKMKEAKTEVPEGGIHAVWTRRRLDLPLESTHAYLLALCIVIHNSLNDIISKPKLTSDMFSVPLNYFMAVSGQVPRYENFCRNPKLSARRKKPVCDFYARFRARLPGFRALTGALIRLDTATTTPAAQLPDDGRYDEAANRDIVKKERVALRQMANELQRLIGIDPKGDEGTLIAEAMVETTPTHEATAAKAGSPARERAMVAHVRAALPPLLVQLGDDHVEPVGDKVGSAAVKVRWGVNFERLTSWDSGVRPLKGKP